MAKLSPADELRLIVQANRIAREIRRRIFEAFARGNYEKPLEAFREAEELIRRFAPQIEAALYSSTVSSYVLGGKRVVAKLGTPSNAPRAPIGGGNVAALLTPVAGFPSVEFPIIDEAVQTLQDSGIVTPEFYYSLARDARQNAFTITADLTEATLQKVRDILAENASESGSRTEFMRKAREMVSELPIEESHLEQVFRNNVNNAYSDGGENALRDPIVADAFPYRAYYPIRDDRARPEHLQLEFLGLDGTNVYHYRDPVWQMFRPPWDWNCRCGWNPLTIRRAAAKGVKFAQQWLETGIEPPNQFVAWPDFRPSPSWQRIAG